MPVYLSLPPHSQPKKKPPMAIKLHDQEESIHFIRLLPFHYSAWLTGDSGICMMPLENLNF